MRVRRKRNTSEDKAAQEALQNIQIYLNGYAEGWLAHSRLESARAVRVAQLQEE